MQGNHRDTESQRKKKAEETKEEGRRIVNDWAKMFKTQI